ncbi:MAG: nucleotidyl transferase AbiEii/AbiGii toxin family protein [Chthoniobacteraceae bacterium]
MPLTEFQKSVLTVLAANRSEASHFAGGLVLNAGADSPRFSHDFDIFHEEAAEVVRSSDRDAASLRRAGFEVTPLSRHGEWEGRAVDFRKALVRGAGGSVEVDWAADSAFRFFPIERDDQLGWRLHLFDMAVNKALALSARTVTRDYVDIVELGRHFPLAAMCWAACGKDPGYSPMLLLEMMRRFARINPLELDQITARGLDPLALKATWSDMSLEAAEAITRLADGQPDIPIGVAFVDAAGRPGWLGDDSNLRAHAPSLRGCWPVVRAV